MRILKPKTKYMYELKPASIFYNLPAVHLVMLARVCGCETVGVWAFTHVCEARNWYCPSSVTHHMLTQALTAHATKWNAEYPVHTHKKKHRHTVALLSNFYYSIFCIVFPNRLRSECSVVSACERGFGWQDLLKAELWIFHDAWCSDMTKRQKLGRVEGRGCERRPEGRWEKEGERGSAPGAFLSFIPPS